MNSCRVTAASVPVQQSIYPSRQKIETNLNSSAPSISFAVVYVFPHLGLKGFCGVGFGG